MLLERGGKRTDLLQGLPPVIQEWVMVAEMAAGKPPSATVSFPGAE